MKKIFMFSALMGILSFVIFSTCNKKSTTPELTTPCSGLQSKQQKVVGRIIEYGSDKPMAGAKIDACILTSPDPLTVLSSCACVVHLVADDNGKFAFEADHYKIQLIEAGDKNTPVFENYYTDDSVLLKNEIHNADSLIIRVVSRTTVNVHIKNSTAKLDSNVAFHSWALFSPYGPYAQSICEPACAIYLHPGIDTSFKYNVFGNADILFDITDYYNISFGNFYYQEKKYMPKNSSDVLEIQF